MSYNPLNSTWLNPNIEYLFDDIIIEYDLRDAGFNLIKQYHLLPDEKIRELTALGKGVERHIAVGKLQRTDKEFSKALGEKFAEMRAIFISANNLTDNDIISVKKDAIYTIGECNKLRFGHTLEFAKKNVYSSYIRFPNIQNLEIYYSNDTMDIKGMSDSSINRHRLYMMEFIREMISLIEMKDSKAKRKMREFIKEFKSDKLDEGFYLEFNNLSKDLNPFFNYMNIIVPLTQIILKEVK